MCTSIYTYMYIVYTYVYIFARFLLYAWREQPSEERRMLSQS